MDVRQVDTVFIKWFRHNFITFARIALFVVYFWFGVLKLFGQSPALPLAHALDAKTIGLDHFTLAFKTLALYECVIGVMFLFPKLTRVVIPLLLIHLLIVCSPLVLLPDLTWSKFLVPTLEGQYIIKNVLIAALAIGVAASVKPLAKN